MKTIALILFAGVYGFAETPAGAPAEVTMPAKVAPGKQVTKSRPASQPQVKTAAAPSQSIPAGAVQVEPYLYRYTDSSGKTWMYRPTPFGVYKYEPPSSSAPEPVSGRSNAVAAADLGDSVRFSTDTPFGKYTWVRKKTELNDDEKAILGTQPVPADTETRPAEKQ